MNQGNSPLMPSSACFHPTNNEHVLRQLIMESEPFSTNTNLGSQRFQHTGLAINLEKVPTAEQKRIIFTGFIEENKPGTYANLARSVGTNFAQQMRDKPVHVTSLRSYAKNPQTPPSEVLPTLQELDGVLDIASSHFAENPHYRSFAYAAFREAATEIDTRVDSLVDQLIGFGIEEQSLERFQELAEMYDLATMRLISHTSSDLVITNLQHNNGKTYVIKIGSNEKDFLTERRVLQQIGSIPFLSPLRPVLSNICDTFSDEGIYTVVTEQLPQTRHPAEARQAYAQLRNKVFASNEVIAFQNRLGNKAVIDIFNAALETVYLTPIQDPHFQGTPYTSQLRFWREIAPRFGRAKGVEKRKIRDLASELERDRPFYQDIISAIRPHEEKAQGIYLLDMDRTREDILPNLERTAADCGGFCRADIAYVIAAQGITDTRGQVECMQYFLRELVVDQQEQLRRSQQPWTQDESYQNAVTYNGIHQSTVDQMDTEAVVRRAASIGVAKFYNHCSWYCMFERQALAMQARQLYETYKSMVLEENMHWRIAA